MGIDIGIGLPTQIPNITGKVIVDWAVRTVDYPI